MSNSFATPRTVASQAPLPMGFPRQEYWSGLPFPSSGDLPSPGIEPTSPALVGVFFTIEPPCICRIKSLWKNPQRTTDRDFPTVQQLGLPAVTAEGLGLIPGQATKISQATWYNQK